ncbi:hypothetical protein DPMN_083917 [Dreissena polymorpha]|uniref:Uncharacterized protein n=1 Tax=Dreissena polymorpha TaxID=45954 RepID=A0A9D3YDM7_DREPO|nr:hypothetical protein DPMN_083917 [Dreissena polymorpha]
MELHILSGERSRSSFKVRDSNLIFGMHVYLMELHILSGEMSRSRLANAGGLAGWRAGWRAEQAYEIPHFC